VLNSPRARLAASVAVSAALVLLGHIFASHGEGLGYDAKFYVAMIEGQDRAVPGPFKFRLLIPFLASVLPFSPALSLLIISYLSLFGMYLLIVRACETLDLSLGDTTFGLLAIWGATWHLYHYYNPYMTDAFALFALSAMLVALLRDAYWPFAAAAVAGTLGRETTAFLVPAWFATRQVAPTLLLIAVTGALIWLPRYLLASASDVTISGALNPDGIFFQPFLFTRQLQTIWGLVWLLALAGIWYLPKAHKAKIAASFVTLFLGALAGSVVATDTGRMFGFLAPVLAVGAAQFYAVVRRQTPTLAWILAGLIAIQGIFNTPDVMFDRSSWLVGWPRRVFLVAEFALGAVILWELWTGRPGRAGGPGGVGKS
jgi:hypothetical protein